MTNESIDTYGSVDFLMKRRKEDSVRLATKNLQVDGGSCQAASSVNLPAILGGISSDSINYVSCLQKPGQP